MTKWIRAGAVGIALALALPSHAGMQLEGKRKISFFAVGSPGFLSIEGKTEEITLEDDGTALTFTVPMDTVETGMGLRDSHMRKKFVQTDQFPNVTLVVQRDQVEWPSGATTKGTLTAAFTAHGVTKDVEVAYTVKEIKTGLRITAEFPFNTSEHGIEIPSYKLVEVDPAMRAEVTIEVTEG